MNGNSKRERLGRFIERAVNESLAELAINNPESAAWLKQNRNWVKFDLAWRISGDVYRMKELADIMNWKKPPRSE